MTDSAERRRRRALRTLIAGAAVAAAAAAAAGAVAVLVWQSGPGPQSGSAAPTASATGAAAPPSTSTPAADAGALPAPARVEQGVPVGYPHTLAGAVSAAAHYTEARDLLSPDAVPGQMMVMARHEDFFKLTSLAAADARDWRRQLGLSETGGSTGSDFVSVQARGYQVEAASTDAVDVWLLTTQTPTVGGIPHGGGDFAVAAPVVWDGGDWKLVQKEMKAVPAVARPGTAQAADAGWRPVAYQH